MKIKGKISKSSYITIILIELAMLLPLFFGDITFSNTTNSDFIIFWIINALVLGLFLWIFFYTIYTIKDGFLYHRSGPFYGKTKISDINKIVYHKGWYVPVMYRPATDNDGLIVTYNKFDEIYISPDKKDLFVEELLKLNPKIIIVKN